MQTEQLNNTFAALADPTRRAILERLAQGGTTVGELSKPFNMSMAAVSKHLKVLEKAQLISREKDAQWRRCQLQPEALKAANDWITQYQRFWEGQFDALAKYLEHNKAK